MAATRPALRELPGEAPSGRVNNENNKKTGKQKVNSKKNKEKAPKEVVTPQEAAPAKPTEESKARIRKAEDITLPAFPGAEAIKKQLQEEAKEQPLPCLRLPVDVLMTAAPGSDVRKLAEGRKLFVKAFQTDWNKKPLLALKYFANAIVTHPRSEHATQERYETIIDLAIVVREKYLKGPSSTEKEQEGDETEQQQKEKAEQETDESQDEPEEPEESKKKRIEAGGDESLSRCRDYYSIVMTHAYLHWGKPHLAGVRGESRRGIESETLEKEERCYLHVLYAQALSIEAHQRARASEGKDPALKPLVQRQYRVLKDAFSIDPSSPLPSYHLALVATFCHDSDMVQEALETYFARADESDFQYCAAAYLYCAHRSSLLESRRQCPFKQLAPKIQALWAKQCSTYYQKAALLLKDGFWGPLHGDIGHKAARVDSQMKHLIETGQYKVSVKELEELKASLQIFGGKQSTKKKKKNKKKKKKKSKGQSGSEESETAESEAAESEKEE